MENDCHCFNGLVVGLFIVLAIVPGFVVLVTTLHIINVDTNSQWISFWGNYLGAITGGALSGGICYLCYAEYD